MEKRKVKLISPTKGHTGLISQKVGRNEACSCGSGRKAKKCCGNETEYHNRERLKRIETIEEQKRRVDGVKY